MILIHHLSPPPVAAEYQLGWKCSRWYNWMQTANLVVL